MIRARDGSSLTDLAATQLVEHYLTDHSAIVDMFDRTNVGPPRDEIEQIDVFAPSVLNAYYQPANAMSSLWNRRRLVEPFIVGITKDDFSSILQSGQLDAVRATVVQLLTFVNDSRNVPYFGGSGTCTAKFCHRLRPNVVPIWDHWVGTCYDGPRQAWDTFVRDVYADVAANLDALIRLQANVEAKIGLKLSVLRIWDVILWTSSGDRCASFTCPAWVPPGP